MNTTVIKLVGSIVAMVLIAGLLFFANALVGNPISQMLAEKTAERYLAEEFAGTDYYIDDVTYAFKYGNYYAHIKSMSSVDTHFELVMTMGGKIKRDTFSDVLNGSTTARRLEGEYRELVNSVLDASTFPYPTRIAYGTIVFASREWIGEREFPPYALIWEDLERDKQYDIPSLGAKAGHLIFYVEDETVSIERAAEILLNIKKHMEQNGVPFYAIDFNLEYPRTESENEGKSDFIGVRNFLSSDIYEDGLAARLSEAHEQTIAYYEEMDAQKDREQKIASASNILD